MWRHMKVRTRILLGYSLILGLTLFVLLFFFLRMEALHHEVEQYSTSQAAETIAGQQLTRQLTLAQQAIDRYLQDPQSAPLALAMQALENLEAELPHTRAALTNPHQQQQLDDLALQINIYHQSFQTLSASITAEQTLWIDLNTRLIEIGFDLRNNLATYLRDNPADLTVIMALNDVQNQLQYLSMTINVQSLDDSDEQLQQIHHRLERINRILQSSTISSAATTGLSITRSIAALSEVIKQVDVLAATIKTTRQQRADLLHTQGVQLQQHVTTLNTAIATTLPANASNMHRRTRQTQQATVLLFGVALVLMFMAATALARTITIPLEDLVAATLRIQRGDYSAHVPSYDRSEIGRLALIFNRMINTLQHQRDEVLQQQAILEHRNQELEHALATIKAANAERELLTTTVRELSVPVVPILDHVLIVPLVGELDQERAQLLLTRLLERISTEQARIAILDITGVPFVDNTTVTWLVHAARAARLLGARCILVGIRPDVAEALVTSGVDLTGLTTRADLRSALYDALRVQLKS